MISHRRGGAFAASLSALLCAALALPAIGAAETYTSPGSSSLTIQGPKVKQFKFNGGAFSSAPAGPGMPARDGASFTLSRGGAANRESHSLVSLPMGKLKLAKNLSSGSWKSNFGSVGKVSVKFRATKALRSVKPFAGCKGANSQSRVGKVTGSLKVNMGTYFKTVRLKSARAVAAKAPQRECEFTDGGSGVSPVSLFAGDQVTSFSASKSGGKVTQQAFVSDGPIQRSLTATSTSADAFTHAGDASSASIKGIGSAFSGALSYAAQSYYEGGSSGAVSGDLTANFVTGKKTIQSGPAGTSSLRVPGFTPPNKVPSAGFYSSQSFGTLDVRFSDGSFDSDGNIVSRSWNFGDGSTSTETNPTHTYAAAGTYTVTLTVTDDRGGSATKTDQVVVEAPEEL